MAELWPFFYISTSCEALRGLLTDTVASIDVTGIERTSRGFHVWSYPIYLRLHSSTSRDPSGGYDSNL